MTYEQVRSAFNKLALLHHPDTARRNDGNDRAAGNVKEFTMIRTAFEAIVEGPDGIAVLKSDLSCESVHSTNSQDNESTSNRELNGTFLHPSLNPSILHEVAEVASRMNPGGLDRGGMWQYANMVKKAKEEGGLPDLQLGGGGEAGEKKRRRRRR